MPEKVLFVIGTGAVGGREKQLMKMALYLSQQRIDTRVAFINQQGPVYDALKNKGLALFNPVLWRSNYSIRYAKPFFSFFSNLFYFVLNALFFRPTVIHAMLPQSYIWGYILSRVLRRPYICGVYGFLPTDNNRTSILMRHALINADAVIANSPHLIHEYMNNISLKASCYVIYNGIDPSPYERPTHLRPKPFICVTVSNFHHYKGYQDLIDAISLLDNEEIEFYFIGEGPLKEQMMKYATSLAVNRICYFVGSVDNVSHYLSIAHLCIHPSHTEGLSNAIIECISFGLPVVACNVGGNSQLVIDDYNGLLVSPSNPVELANAVRSIYCNPEKRILYSANSHKHSLKFAWEECIEKHLEVYSHLRKSRR